jgi:hypothetical protein
MIMVGRGVGLSIAAAAWAAVLALCAQASAQCRYVTCTNSQAKPQTQTQTPTQTQTQAQTHKKKADPKAEPTSADLFEYIRGSLIEFSPDDRINDNLDAALDPTATVLTIKQPDGHCDQFLSALDANTLVWDIYDASDSMTTRQPLLRLTVVSLPGKHARTCYDNEDQVDNTVPANRARFLFSLAKIPDQIPFQVKMSKAMKKLIALSGGYAEKDIFKNP